MKNILFVLLFIFCSSNLFSQEVTNDEYEIYGTIIGKRGFQFYPINFEVPLKFHFNIDNDSIYDKIRVMKSKEIDLKKLYAVALKYSAGKSFTILKTNVVDEIFFSPIYFTSNNEAYFLLLRTSDFPKPNMYFFRAKKVNNFWEIEDYYYFM